MKAFRALKHYRLPPGSRLCLMDDGLPLKVSPEDPAIHCMTDLHRVPAVTTKASASIDHALQHMIHTGVRMLFVLDDADILIGLITARDLTGEKPIRIAAEKGLTRDEITVQDVMIGQHQIDVLDLSEVERSMVGDIVLTLRDAGRQHALVRENRMQQTEIRGVFSISQIARQLDLELSVSDAVQSFSELEHILSQDD